MPDYRRLYIPGGLYFFTLVTHRRRRFLTDALARECLRVSLDLTRKSLPFDLVAIVLLPDHLHTLWKLPDGDDDFSFRWKCIKEGFTKDYLGRGGTEAGRSPSRKRRQERSIWQRRFWEHAIRDEQDFERHMDYIHYNPVKHGLVERPFQWPYSSFHRYVKLGVYPENWGCGPRWRLTHPTRWLAT
jgi:putative transposase